MKLLTSPKKEYLLEAGIEVLHEQSNEWMQEIAFWYDELSFLYSLVLKKTLKSVPVNAKDRIQLIENELIKLTGGELDRLKLTVELHEKFLSNLLEGNSNVSEKFYREKHHHLSMEFEQFEKRFKSLKKEVFSLVELIVRNGY